MECFRDERQTLIARKTLLWLSLSIAFSVLLSTNSSSWSDNLSETKKQSIVSGALAGVAGADEQRSIIRTESHRFIASKSIPVHTESSTSRKLHPSAELTQTKNLDNVSTTPFTVAIEYIRHLPEFTLALMLIAIGLLFVAVQQAVSSQLKARSLEKKNAKLSAELRQRKHLENEVKFHRDELEGKLDRLSALNQELAIARDLAIEGSRLKSDFVANISHEIRTPISAVIGMNMLLLNTKLDKKQREYASLANESAQSLLIIINDILDFSKIEAGKLEIHTSKFALESVIKEIMDMLAPGVASKPVVLMSIFEPALIHSQLRGDPYRLRQVLINLASNAIKFTREGEIVIYGRKSVDATGQDTVQFSVIDTGIGIPVKAQTKLFRPFVQADGFSSSKYGGTGLGLSISKRLVELMGGNISVESSEGKGAIFSFNLPLWANANVEEEDFSPAGIITNVHIISRNLNYPAMLSEHLQKLGYTVSTRNELDDRNSLLAMLKGEKSIVITDFGASDLVQAVLNNDPALKGIPIIMIRNSEHETLQNNSHVFYLNNPVLAQDIDRLINSISSSGSMLTHDQATVAEISPPLESPPVRSAILVAEDSVVLQTMVKQLLERLGCSVEIVSTGKEAVEASSKRHFNLILMDWQMPEMDGLEATRLIRASENAAGRHTPIIAMTANAMQGDKDKCMEAGMDGYLAKPFKLDELKAIVSQYKSESGSEEQNAA
jgi:two-component system sensor histidine kinase/response regulator